MNRCASCRAAIPGQPHQWIPTVLPNGRINPRMHAICSRECVDMCRRGTDFVAMQWFLITDHLSPELVYATVEEHGRQAYDDWEARRGIATSERVN